MSKNKESEFIMKMLHTQFFFVCSNNENIVVGKVFVPNKDIRKRFNEMYSRELYISETEIPFYQLRSFKDYSFVQYKIQRTKVKLINPKRVRISKDISQNVSNKQTIQNTITGSSIMKEQTKSNIICIPYRTKLSSDLFCLNVTSRAKSPFSPFLLHTENGIMENVWQFSKVYSEHVDDNGNIKDEWFKWHKDGLNNGKAIKNPMGKGVKPLFFFWNDNRISYVEARKQIYIPTYTQSVLDNSKKEFDELVDIWSTLHEQEKDLYLRDFDGFNRHQLNMSFEDVVNCESKHLGHSFVLEKMILSVSTN
jgi:hypothetical protein